MPVTSHFAAAIGDVQGRRDDDLYRRQLAYRDQQASTQSQTRYDQEARLRADTLSQNQANWQMNYDLRIDELAHRKDQASEQARLRREEAGKGLPPPNLQVREGAGGFESFNPRTGEMSPIMREGLQLQGPGGTGDYDEYDWPVETTVDPPQATGGAKPGGWLNPLNWGRRDATAAPLEGPPPLTTEGARDLMGTGWQDAKPGPGSLGGLGLEGMPQQPVTAEQRTDELLAEGMGREEIRAILQREGLIGAGP